MCRWIRGIGYEWGGLRQFTVLTIALMICTRAHRVHDRTRRLWTIRNTQCLEEIDMEFCVVLSSCHNNHHLHGWSVSEEILASTLPQALVRGDFLSYFQSISSLKLLYIFLDWKSTFMDCATVEVSRSLKMIHDDSRVTAQLRSTKPYRRIPY